MASEEAFEGGELLICGGTDWANVGKATGGSKSKKSDKEKMDEAARAEAYPNLIEPHRIKSLMGVKVKWVASGSAACHTIIGTADGKVFTLGRNEKGQLGLGDTCNRNLPTEVESLAGHNIVSASCGKFHTAFVAESGDVFMCGSNLQGQCGTGSLKSKKDAEELLLTPAKVDGLPACQRAACGAEFTMWLCGGRLWSAGYPQYGQLGHGDDHEHNTKDSSIKVAYEAQPTPKMIQLLTPVSVVNVACGHNHTIAIDDNGACYSWGNGGYGRLGHKEQKDEFGPRQLEVFSGRILVDKEAAVVAAGSLSSWTTTVGGQLYSWGKLKNSGDNTMYPKPFMELAGWTIRSIACGATHYAVAAHYGDEEAAVAWGTGSHGELGYGPNGKKSSANPEKVKSLDGVKTYQVACGMGHTLFLCDANCPKVQSRPVWHCDLQEPPAAEGGKGFGGKRKADGGAKGGRKKKA